jgi:hypothetical protein
LRPEQTASEHGGMVDQLPLPALLSQALVALVAFTLDNEFEHRMPHRTTDSGAGRAGRQPSGPSAQRAGPRAGSLRG